MKSILFILPVATQPRFAKRIQSYLNQGYSITIASFERDYFDKNELPKVKRYISLGTVEDGNYVRRIPKIIGSFTKLMPLVRQNDFVFIFSADLLILLTPFINRKKVIYEIGDLRSLTSQGVVNGLFAQVYGRCLRKLHSIFVTSQGFEDYLVDKYRINPDVITLIENKLMKSQFDTRESIQSTHLQTHEFTLGIVGLLRYRNIIDFLDAFKQISPRFKVVIYGGGPLLAQIKPFIDNNRITYKGQFKYPDDISGIYDEIDLSFTMYDVNDINVRLALPNKLYETIYFRKPILVTKGTFLETKVKEYGVGFSWDQKDMEGLVKYLDSPSFIDDYNSLTPNFDFIPTHDFLV